VGNLIAARLGCYGEYGDAAWDHLPPLGIRHVEMGVPAVARRLADHGLSASSLEAGCDVRRSDVADSLKGALDACVALGAKVCFLSVHAGDMPREVALTTMHAVGHPRVRVNFDTANVLYYNTGRTTIGELEKIAGFVASVHLKDSTGAFRTDVFPTLGTGIVDFPEVFRILGARGFTGPFTLDLEGPEKRTREEQLRHVAESVEHLRRIGALDPATSG